MPWTCLPQRKAAIKARRNWVFDKMRIQADMAMDGYHCIVTTEQESFECTAVEAYRGFFVLKPFWAFKSTMGACLVFACDQKAIGTRFLIYYVAFMITRLI